jgi:hypothetical protein
VQTLPSEHALACGVATQPTLGEQESAVQGLPSLHEMAPPPRHCPPAHVSLTVHALPSLQGAKLPLWMHPAWGEQESVVQTLPSSQLAAGPGVQAPAAHASAAVQALPSLQGF